MGDIEKRLEAIEERNARVEQDKTWETSWTRRTAIAILTYIVVVIYLNIIHNDKPFINAAVPAIGFFLSTLVLKQVRIIWQRKLK
jgi:hypothetical protein